VAADDPVAVRLSVGDHLALLATLRLPAA
jgi:hypothetical protein